MQLGRPCVVRLTIFAAMKQIAEEQKVALPPLEDGLSLHERASIRWRLPFWSRPLKMNSASTRLTYPRTRHFP
jgi:hypothetical protein